MAPRNEDYDDDNNNEDDNNDEVVPLVTGSTTTSNGTRSTVSSSTLQIEGTEDEDGITNGTTKSSTSKNIMMSKHHQSRLRYILICVVVSMIVLLYAKRNNTNNSVDENISATTTPRPHHDKVVGKPKLTLKSLRTLRKQMIKEHDKFNEQLQTLYGKYYEDIFYVNKSQTRVSRGSLLFESGNSKSKLSKQRFQRKLMMKILEASAYTYHDDANAETNTNNTLVRDTKFIWATGGHSATAGHGNFYNESYTAYIQYALEGIFRSVNVELITRKYAMGGTSAGSELALCTKEIYGTDFDVLIWDFGMTDGGNYWKQVWYNYRANLLPYQNPIHMTYHPGSRSGPRNDLMNTFELMGMAALISNEDVMNQAEAAMPDNLGMSDKEIDELPEYVRSYKCGVEIENGDPYCRQNKYHNAECPDRKFQVSWHPGYKWHALMGYLASYYVIDVLYNAMDELEKQLSTNDAVTIYKTLQDQGYQDYDLFQKAPFPAMGSILDSIDVDDFNVTHLMRGPNYCHTTKLPSEVRYLGILTETTTQIGSLDYDKGIGVRTLVNMMYDSDGISTTSGVQPMMLSYDEEDRQNCPIPTNLDYKDFFYVGANTGWRQLILPNQFERNAYYNDDKSSKPPQLQGFVAMCMTLCPWDQCPGGVWSRNAYNDPNNTVFEVRINQVMVTDFINLGSSECDMLRHSDGYRFPINKEENTVTIEAQLNVPDASRSYIRISAWIVW